MLNAHQYAKLIENYVGSCQFIDDPPRFASHIEIPQDNPNALFWTDRIQFQQGVCLTVSEQAFFDDEGMVERAFAYDFREMGTGRLVWRIDNHCRRQHVSSSCHVHADPDDEKKRTEFFADSRATTFPYAMHCVNNFFQDKPQEWEGPRNVKNL